MNNKDIFWENFEAWICYYRLNIHRFCEQYLGLSLKLFQKIIIYAMDSPNAVGLNTFVYFASRGLGKTYLTMVFCLAKAILYPGIKIRVAAPNIKQATLLIGKAIELRRDHPNIDREIEGEIKMNKDQAKILLKNGSTIETVVCGEGARGERANIIIMDESRGMNKNVIDTVFVPFLTGTRMPPYSKNPKYEKYLKKEHNSKIFLTSIGYKDEWSYKDFESFAKLIADKTPNYNIIALPYQFGVESGIISRALIESQIRENKTDIHTFQMEMEVIPFGESDSSMFTYTQVNRARKLVVPLIPPTDSEYIEHRGDLRKMPFYQRKESFELRVISMDIAVSAGRLNDNTVFTVFRLTNNGDHYIKELSYIEVMNGVNLDRQILRLKQLFYDLECDYAVIDAGGALGINAANTCGQITMDVVRGRRYPGWSTCNKNEKFDIRVTDPNAVPVMFCIQVSGASASTMQYNMVVNAQLEFERNRIFLLSKEDDIVDDLNNRFGYMKLATSSNPLDKEKANNMILPFINTTELVKECVETQVYKLPSGRWTFDEKNGRKDRVISMIYGLYFINELEKDLYVDQGKYKAEDYFTGGSSGTGFGGKGVVNPFVNNLNKLGGFGGRR